MTRLPFFSRPALGVAVLTLVLLALAWVVTGGGIASPGLLSSSTGDGDVHGNIVTHADLDQRCSACHAPPWSTETTSSLCLACHEEVRADVTAGNGMHGRLEMESCLGCHTEHKGRDGILTSLDGFDHSKTDFVLGGAHAAVACDACHGASTYDSAPSTCAECHAKDDAHEGRYGAACQECHDDAAWKPATFDHAATRFTLTGAHERVECVECHAAGEFKGARTECVACHPGPATHQGVFGDDCESCHTTTTWKGAEFDHAKAGFALGGAHVRVACGACHGGSTYDSAPSTCAECHAKDDAHEGRYGAACQECHDDAAWKPATFDHAATRFTLTGAHERVECVECHAAGEFKGARTECVACHPGPATHQGVFGDDCETCHTTATWKGAKFDHRFPLRHGSRTPIPCETCHPASWAAYTCYGCHEHTQAQIAGEHREEGIRDFADCMECHPTGREEEGEGGGRGDREGEDD